MKLGVLLLLCVFLALAGSYASAGVSAELYYADGITPLEYSDIMVGTQLKIIISSSTALDEPYYFYGSLVLEDSNIPQAVLSADYYGSPSAILPAAGDFASIYSEIDSDWYGTSKTVEGVQFAAKGMQEYPTVGDWFIVDYNAIALGPCEIKLYQTFPPFNGPPEDPAFLQTIPLKHVKTRDISNNYVVGFDDFAYLAKYWQVADCGADSNCHKVDFDGNNNIDLIDLMEFADYWLEKTR